MDEILPARLPSMVMFGSVVLLQLGSVSVSVA